MLKCEQTKELMLLFLKSQAVLLPMPMHSEEKLYPLKVKSFLIAVTLTNMEIGYWVDLDRKVISRNSVDFAQTIWQEDEMIGAQPRVHGLKPDSHPSPHVCQFSLIPLIPRKRHAEECPFIKRSAYSHFTILFLWVERQATKECSNGEFPFDFPKQALQLIGTCYS